MRCRPQATRLVVVKASRRNWDPPIHLYRGKKGEISFGGASQGLIASPRWILPDDDAAKFAPNWTRGTRL